MTKAGVGIRLAVDADVGGIRKVFEAVYKNDYPYEGFYDEKWLRHCIYNDDILMLVAESGGEIIGTSSIVFQIGAFNDLVAEFGRLAVSPDARGKGVGHLLMEERLRYAQERIHVGIVENRTAHQYSQRISQSHGFVPVGFLPQKHLFRVRESMSLFVQHFGNALKLRNNHPRIVPEVQALAHAALTNCGLQSDTIIDEDTHAYAMEDTFECQTLLHHEIPALLRIERGRIHNREVFGSIRLHYGFFRVTAQQADYLVARPRADAHIAGAIGYIYAKEEHSLKIVEIIAGNEASIRFLLEHLLEHARSDMKVSYIEIDVSAYAPRMQRTLVELGFLPTAYVPAMVFHQVERLDIVRMSRLLIPFDPGHLELVETARHIKEIVCKPFERRAVIPPIARALEKIKLFEGLNREQARRVASACSLADFAAGSNLYEADTEATELFIVIEGEVIVNVSGNEVARLGAGESVGETAVLTNERHGATIVAAVDTQTARLPAEKLTEVIRKRPDIGLVLYRNLAAMLGRRLRSADMQVIKELY